MYKYFFLILVLLSFGSIAQVIDSTNNQLITISDSTFALQDTVQVNDSLLTKVKRDSIAPLYASILSDKSFIISNHELSHNDYKYTGDFLRLLPFNFIKDLGFSGQQNETFLYGVGNNSISYLMDGVSVNDRYSNSLNLNLIQSEDVDSIEIVPLPRGFLYGAYSNPVSVNFITNDFITKQPYTRIRFYQGANRDMMFDGSFNAKIMNRLIASFDITNRILDETYDATEYSIWQGKFKLKYLLSNDVNIIASYNINDYKSGYSGGVNVDSITASGRVVDDVMYSSLENPPMFYPNGRLNTLTHLPRLRVLATPTKWLKTDASVYYLYNDFKKVTESTGFAETKTYGLNINNNIKYSLLTFGLNLDYEKTKSLASGLVEPFPLSTYSFENDVTKFSGSLIISADIDSTFIPSLFYKISNSRADYLIFDRLGNDEQTSSGLGLDILFRVEQSFNFYIGSSVFKPNNSSSSGYSFVEVGAEYYTDFIDLDIKYFLNEYTYRNYNRFDFEYVRFFGNLEGFSGSVNFKLGFFILESISSLYSPRANSTINVPNFQTQTGLYFKDILFDNNLDLKTGFVFYYTGKNNVFTYENGLVEVPASNKLDFTLVGEIQKTAIIYFTWQNLLGNNYYITPYYPMPGRSIRFGVAWEMFN
jgi:hypothetical protein